MSNVCTQVYAPRRAEEEMPRFSSRNFAQVAIYFHFHPSFFFNTCERSCLYDSVPIPRCNCAPETVTVTVTVTVTITVTVTVTVTVTITVTVFSIPRGNCAPETIYVFPGGRFGLQRCAGRDRRAHFGVRS